MATPKVYVICDQNCKFEGMTKEQILTAISQAVESGEIKDIDAGFIQTVKTINGVPLRFFVGEKWAYDDLSDEQKENLFAIITNDTTKEELFEELEALQKRVKELSELTDADHATTADYATEAGKFKTIGGAADNVARNVWFSDSEDIGLPRKDDNFKYNPYTNTLKVGAVNADKLGMGSPTDLTSNALSGKGYYLICANYGGQLLNFGLLYWDGASITGAQGYGAYSVGINYDGSLEINMKQDDSYKTITADCDIKIKQIAIV